MALTLRIPKGEKLTIQEADNNFTYLENLAESKLSTSSFTEYSQSVDTRIDNIVIGTGFATTGSNTFTGNQIITGSLTVRGGVSQVGIGDRNTIIGDGAGVANTVGLGGGDYNTFIGVGAAASNISGRGNTVLGPDALGGNVQGDSNIAIGTEAGTYSEGFQPNSTVNESIFIGNGTESKLSNQTNQIVIGNFTVGNGSNTVTIGNNSILSTHLKGTVFATTFTGSFVGDGSGLTGIAGGGSIDTSSFATTGSNTFTGDQTISGSVNISESIRLPGSGSFRDFINGTPSLGGADSIKGNGAGLFNLVEQGDANVLFTVTRITTKDLTGAITSNLSGANNGTYSDVEPTTDGEGRGARLRIIVSGGIVTSVTILNIANSNLNYEEHGQPANRQGIGYKAGDTLTVPAGTGGIGGTGDLILTLRAEDIETYIGQAPGLAYDYNSTRTLTVANNIRATRNLTIGPTQEGVSDITNSASGAIAAGANVTIGSGGTNSLVVGVGNSTTHQASTVLGAFNEASASGQTIIGVASISTPGTGAFVIGNGTNDSNRSNLLVAVDNTVQITGSLDISESTAILSAVSASLNFADDTAAGVGGVPLGGLYRNGNVIQIRLT